MAEDDGRKLDRDELWKFYEKAIEGRNAHYAQYIHFMNLYAIFTGALFVAFYSLVNSNSEKNLDVYALIVAFLGLVTSILWLCSVKGYYAWILNWINVVKYYEECLNEGCEDQKSRFVYGIFYKCNTKKCFLISPFRFSTQKLTMLFVEITILGWLVVICLLLQDFFGCLCGCSIFPIVIVLGYLFAIIVVFFVCFNEELKDNVKMHYRLKDLRKDELVVVKKTMTVKAPSLEED